MKILTNQLSDTLRSSGVQGRCEYGTDRLLI